MREVREEEGTAAEAGRTGRLNRSNPKTPSYANGTPCAREDDGDDDDETKYSYDDDDDDDDDDTGDAGRRWECRETERGAMSHLGRGTSVGTVYV